MMTTMGPSVSADNLNNAADPQSSANDNKNPKAGKKALFYAAAAATGIALVGGFAVAFSATALSLNTVLLVSGATLAAGLAVAYSPKAKGVLASGANAVSGFFNKMFNTVKGLFKSKKKPGPGNGNDADQDADAAKGNSADNSPNNSPVDVRHAALNSASRTAVFSERDSDSPARNTRAQVAKRAEEQAGKDASPSTPKL